ncbi:hypothetical protein CANCADRAFT_15183, partial [Tortispora caseinolytica NRRL Y-17796]
LMMLAVQAASLETIQQIVSHPKATSDLIGLNFQDDSGNTPLHSAVFLDRADVVSFLLNIPDIDDTIRNANNLQAVELAPSPHLAQVMQVLRAQYIEKVAIKFLNAFRNNDIPTLESILANHRAASLIDINGENPDTGLTILHEAVSSRNIQMIDFILNHGGDPFRRDSKGKLPIDYTKDDSVRKLLKSASKNLSIETDPGILASGSLKGYLKKWTNYRNGYKLRYFVLENDVLSYYKNQDDTQNACRGSINMRIATLKVDSSEKQSFTVAGKGSARFHLKANHPAEAKRWIWSLQQAIQHAKDVAAGKIKENSPLFYVSSEGRQSATFSSGHRTTLSVPSLHDSTLSLDVQSMRSSSPSLSASGPSKSAQDFYDDADDSVVSGDESLGDVGNSFNHTPFSVLGRSLLIDVDLLLGIVSSANELASRNSSDSFDKEQYKEVYSTVMRGLSKISEMTSKLIQAADSETKTLEAKLQREKNLRSLWEENILKLEERVQEYEKSLLQLSEEKKEARRAFKSVVAAVNATNTEEGHTVADEVRLALKNVENSRKSSLPQIQLRNVFDESSDDEFYDAIDDIKDEDLSPEPEDITIRSDVDTLATKSSDTSIPELAQLLERLEVLDPRKIADILASASSMQLQKLKEIQSSFHGYEDPPRTRLRLSADDRPTISLWGILKNLIGKDMTRMTLPVSFNECTSLLQRVAEDLEYTDLLEKAAIRSDSTLRMVFVAAFAASEYASTTKRVAKPFNPLLGETYEYCRPDHLYRFFVEQVSHHPPVSAAYAESPLWTYYGESAVKSKFNGRSFDINPLGTWYLELRPFEAPEELYTWKKVNTSVVGIITGSPVVDNYGDMEVTNHTTGDRCILHFKARGWRGANAFEVRGEVLNAKGIPVWSIGGKWNSRLIAKRVTGKSISGANSFTAEELTHVASKFEQGVSDRTSKPFLVWKVHERPDLPFYLTTFAVSLNALPERLIPWLAPTDTRLRPDQRAMEDGDYDKAANDKVRLEEAQRARRREREQKGQGYKPRWFKKSKHPITGSEYWRFLGEYWETRE